jgi:hypothetical protein
MPLYPIAYSVGASPQLGGLEYYLFGQMVPAARARIAGASGLEKRMTLKIATDQL